uniref:Uncharacterized protein n=1 Tax=Setaria italica TaxID=4555 RepID=K3YNK8_SETIT
MTRHDKQFPINTLLAVSNIFLLMAGSSHWETAAADLHERCDRIQ